MPDPVPQWLDVSLRKVYPKLGAYGLNINCEQKRFDMNDTRVEKKYTSEELAAILADCKVKTKEDYLLFLAALLEVAWAAGQNTILKAAIEKPLDTYTASERKKVMTFALDQDHLQKLKECFRIETLRGEEKK